MQWCCLYSEEYRWSQFILDTGAPDFIYLFTTAIRQLNDLGVIKPTYGHYRIRNFLGPNDKKVDNPHVDAIPLQYKIKLREMAFTVSCVVRMI